MILNIQRSFHFLLISFNIIALVPSSISNDLQSDNHIFETWGITKMKVERLRYKWTIENFSLNEQETGQNLISPIFSSRNNNSCKWQLNLYPKGYNTAFSNYVSVTVNPISCTPKVKFQLGILNAKHKKISVFNGEYNFEKISNISVPGIPGFIQTFLLSSRGNDILSDDKLIVFCELNVTIGVESISGESGQSGESGESNHTNHTQSSTLGKDLAYLFENPNFGDVILSVGGKEIKALKGILASRSSVFRTMFESDTKEENTSTVEIADLEYDVVKEMVRYIYTEEALNLENLAPGLLAASEKYKLDGLKAFCTDTIVENLTSENAAKMYILSETNSAPQLKEKVKDFIVSHAASVIPNPEFKSIIQEHPQLVEDVFSALSEVLLASSNNTNS